MISFVGIGPVVWGRAGRELLARVADKSEWADMKEREHEEEEADRHASGEAHEAKDVVKDGKDGRGRGSVVFAKGLEDSEFRGSMRRGIARRLARTVERGSLSSEGELGKRAVLPLLVRRGD